MNYEEITLFDEILLEASNTPESLKDIKDDKSGRKTLLALAQSIINDNQRKSYRVNTYTVNCISNIISKSLLPKWAHGYRRFTIILDNKTKGKILEFKVPKFGYDFIGRFIDGREPLNAFLHRIPEIKVRMTPAIFDTLTEPEQLVTFFKKLINYYDAKVDTYSIALMREVRRLNPGVKELIRTTSLSGLVTIPLMNLFVFSDVDMSDTSIFTVSKEEINTLNKFIKEMVSKYKSPAEEKNKILSELKNMINEFKESGVDISCLTGFTAMLESFYNGSSDAQIKNGFNKFIYENTDHEWSNNQTNSEIKYYQEKFGVKKLKKIPADTIAYIAIETESIKDANDKMMIASYCLGKIEIVEWYIELIDTGNKKYIVPHNKPYLENMRTQLLQCYKNIMAVKITPPSERPIIDIKYPKGYEG